MVSKSQGKSESSDGYQAGNVNNEAVHVIGLHGSVDSLSLFLHDWELAKVALRLSHGPGHLVPGKCTKWKGDVAGLSSERAC